MPELNFDWMTILYDESVRDKKAEGTDLCKMTEDALKQAREISRPGRDVYRAKKKENPNFHPRDMGGGCKIRAQDAFVFSRCGTENSLVGLLLSNAGIKGLSV